jgi:Na+/H+-translocating membrane pyrophosphatase
MITPGMLVVFTPLIVGSLCGPEGVAGLVAGTLVSGIPLAISFSISGGAWDSSKKYIEADRLLFG